MRSSLWWIVGVVVLALVIWGIMGNNGNQDSSSTADNGQAGSWAEGEHETDFGDTSFGGGLLVHEYALINSSDSAVNIQNVTTNCGCTTAEIIHGPHTIGPYGTSGIDDGAPSWSIMPGENYVVRATFDPAFHGEGSIGRSVTRVITLDTDRGKQDLTFTATIVK